MSRPRSPAAWPALLAFLAALAWAGTILSGGVAQAQAPELADAGEAADPAAESAAESASETDEAAEARAAAARAAAEALVTLRNLLASIDDKNAQADSVRAEIEAAETDVDREEAAARLQALTEEIAQLDGQVEALATGVSPEAFSGGAPEAFDLQEELQQLVEPFVLMLKSATEDAREIESLRRTVLSAEKQAAQAEKAIRTLDPLLEAAPVDGVVASRLRDVSTLWRERRDAAEDQAAAASRQLESRLAAQNDPSASAGAAFQAFFSERGRNLAFGVSAFAATFFLLRLVRRGLLALLGAPRNRSVPARFGAFLFDGLTLLAAFGAMLAVFNSYNDWLLTGLTVLLLLALGWFVLRSAPSLFEQVTLLLNLGAVQEGERVMLGGVPWKVKRLDFYTDLENPALRGGAFTVPIRELKGLHSRPPDKAEVWFPSAEGDWVLLESGLWGEVIFQSPELVQVREEGGAVTTFPIDGYLAQNPKNLSHGFRVETVIGLDYAHQAEAVAEIPAQLAAYVRERLGTIAPEGSVLKVDAELIGAGTSSLDIEVGAELTGAAGSKYEDVAHALTRLAVACCTAEGWRIPYPTMTLKRG